MEEDEIKIMSVRINAKDLKKYKILALEKGFSNLSDYIRFILEHHSTAYEEELKTFDWMYENDNK